MTAAPARTEFRVPWVRRSLLFAAIVACSAGLGTVIEGNVIDYVVRLLLLSGINVILAVGLNLINGTAGQFSIGHAGFMAVGAYLTAFTVITLERYFGAALGALPPLVAAAIVLNAGLAVGAVAAGIAGVVVGAPSLRLRGDYLAIVTLGFGEIIRLLFNNAEVFGGATGYSGGRPLGLPTYTNFLWVALWAIGVTWAIRNLTVSRYGRALAAIREDEVSAEAMGIPTTRMKVLAFVVSSMAAGIAGGLFAHLQSTVRPDDFKFDRSIDVIIMIIVGGLGSITGAVLGAISITILLELLRQFGDFRLIVYPLILILTMLLRPQGILGRRELPLTRIFPGLRAAPKGASLGDEARP